MASDNSKPITWNSKRILPAFTLVELIIVVSILGILAAIVLPEFQNHQQKAKETQAKANLKLLRDAIERYAVDHGVPPGYPDNDSTQTPNYLLVFSQLTVVNKYLSELPKNPFNDKMAFLVLMNNESVTEGMEVNPAHGWIYHPATKTVKINWPGADSEGNSFFDY